MSKVVLLKFPKGESKKPVMYELAKHHDVVFNILKAQIDINEEGHLLAELSGKNIDKGLNYLRDSGVIVEALKVKRDDDRCTSCGACLVVCPSGALHIKDRTTMEVEFDKEKCIDCEFCVKACPFKAMQVGL